MEENMYFLFIAFHYPGYLQYQISNAVIHSALSPAEEPPVKRRFDARTPTHTPFYHIFRPRIQIKLLVSFLSYQLRERSLEGEDCWSQERA